MTIICATLAHPFANEICYTVFNMKKFIMYSHSSGVAAAHLKALGASRAAHCHGWSFLRTDLTSRRDLHRQIDYWKPDGCLVDAIGAKRSVLSDPVFKRIPTVFIDCDPQKVTRQMSCVLQDPDTIAKVAAEELLRHNLRTYAYVQFPGRPHWSVVREKAFARAMKSHGVNVSQFCTDNRPPSRRSVVDRLCPWLKAQPLPIGIFTTTDAMSEHVLEATRICNLDVPRDVVIIGVDNEEFFCENNRPSLSSIEIGHVQAGEQAARILQTLIANPHHAPIQEKFSDTHVVIRSSTRRTPNPEPKVMKALDFIRTRATSGLTASEVLALFTCSRRRAEQRFKLIAGRSILDEIHAVQIAHAKKLISNPQLKLTAIPGMCGHQAAPFFQRLFRNAVGMTMTEYRKALLMESSKSRP